MELTRLYPFAQTVQLDSSVQPLDCRIHDGLHAAKWNRMKYYLKQSGYNSRYCSIRRSEKDTQRHIDPWKEHILMSNPWMDSACCHMGVNSMSVGPNRCFVKQ